MHILDNLIRFRNKKASIGTTILWVASTLVIAFLCLVVIALVVTFAKSSEVSFTDSLAYPEKAYMLNSLLNKQINGERVDDRILAGNFDETNKILGKFPGQDKVVWTINTIKKDENGYINAKGIFLGVK